VVVDGSFGLGNEWKSFMFNRCGPGVSCPFLYTPILAASILFSWSALAGVRAIVTAETFNNFIDQNPTVLARELVAGGDFEFEGGVVLRGRARFFREIGSERRALSPKLMTLRIDKQQMVSLISSDKPYSVEMHKGLACPLGKFVERDGKIAYTIPEGRGNVQKMTAAGLVDQKASVGDPGLDNFLPLGSQKIAKEFADGPFVRLLFAADFAQTVPLLAPMKNSLIKKLNDAVGPGRGEPQKDWASYFNTDEQMPYNVYLVDSGGRIDMEGGPLRYYWNYGVDRSAVISDVKALSQNWPENSRLTDFFASKDRATQYDVISLFQTAALFRELKSANSVRFRSFVAAACDVK
jgi:hypothetical protein